MSKRLFIVVCCCLLQSFASRAQCLPGDSLRRQMQLLKISGLDTASQIRQLLQYESLAGRCPWRSDSIHEILLRRIGTLYNYKADYARAAEYYNRATNIITANFKSLAINRRQLVTNYYFLSGIYAALHNLPEKRKAEDRCIDMGLHLGMSSDISCLRSLYARVEYSFDMGDYPRCIDDALMCEQLARQYLATPGSTASLGESIAASSHGWCIESLLRLQDFAQVEQMLTNKAAEYKKAGLTRYLGFTSVEQAELQLHKHNHQRALVYYNQALQYEKAVGNEFNYKQTLKAIGDELYFSYFNDPLRALSYYREALRHNCPPDKRSGVDSIEDASILNNIANVYVRQNRFDSAFAYFVLAFNQVRPGSDETDILNSSEDKIDPYKKIHYLARLLIDKADAWRQQYRVTGDKKAVSEAARIYHVADKLLGRIDAAQSDLRSRLFWRSDTRRLYEHAIDLCWLQGNEEEAFYFFEQSRAVLLNDQLMEQRLQGGDAISRQSLVKRRIVELERDIDAVGNDLTRYNDIKTLLFAAHRELDSLDREIKARSPLYYQGFLDSSHATLATTRNSILQDHSGLLEVFYGDSAVYTLLVTPGRNRLQRINKAGYDSTVGEYLAFLGNPALLNRDLPGYARTAHHLYQLLFGDHPLPPGRLIVSPDGRPFPLESLVTNTDPHAPVYMISDYALSYTYSARYLQNSFIDPGAAPAGSFLGVAPVQYAAGMKLAALQGSDRSLETISDYFHPSLTLLSGEATRDRFLREFSNYRVIQLYTHSCDSSGNKEPVIYFADSALYLSDLIPDNKPATQLIVLSACETANGRFYRGEGVFSFNRGFAALGIPTSVSNLWSVDNTSTYRITELFYKYLSQHLPADLALQKAKLDFIRTCGSREKQLPYYWAASIIIGKTDPLDYPGPSAWPWIAAGSSLLLLCFLAWRRHTRKTPPGR